VRKALATLPWVEHKSVLTDVSKTEVRFNLKDRTAFDEGQLQKALEGQGFPEMTVRSRPSGGQGGPNIRP
jgi:hypothetical protein